MRRLEVEHYSSLKNAGIDVIASCVDKIEKLKVTAGDVTLNVQVILSDALSSRTTLVSLRKLYC